MRAAGLVLVQLRYETNNRPWFRLRYWDPAGAEEAMRELLTYAERDVRRVFRRRQQAASERK